ncbi:C39 family peptidase [Mycolicibacterium mageritense]|uniref:Peptidase C39-like domain-containing protein n=1 Tax=Mycolicibacterium mageritense TaxID=53462 RepID=A0AAI8XSI5_MYCME|nr:C39 family peptidase [Mycolicibacterium mageritense]BDY33145.1 hypothetical protein hbim_07120 [Mycolicibacterium mageritense]
MTEKILPYDRSIVPQEYGWSCGPAATQVVLNSRGIIVAETSLLNQIEGIENPGRGDDRDGTDYVGLIERVLDNIVPDACYTSVYLPQDPPSFGQKEALWANLKRSIDGGFGVVMNWVAPPSNKPRGVKGSVSPRYSGGTTYHYVAAMGYDDNPAARAVWIADSGFQPFGYWISFDQCASLIPPKGYAYADVAPAAGGPSTPPADPAPTADQVSTLAQAMSPTSLSRERLAEYLPHFAEAMRAAEITTVRRAAAWCSQVGHESAGLRYMAEIQTDGPGWTEDRRRYRGRGPIQLTWSSNYRKFGQWCATKGYITDSELFVKQPELVEQPRWGFLAASWYWLNGGPKPGQINGFADRGDILAVSRCVNGWIENRDPVGWPDRRERWDRCLAMGDRLLTLSTPSESPDPLEELLMSDLEVESLSIYATPGESKIPIVRMVQSIDAALHRVGIVEPDAALGDPDALFRMLRTARGQGKYGTQAGPVNHAKAKLAELGATSPAVVAYLVTAAASGDATARDILADIERTNPEVIQQFINSQKGSQQ